MRLQGDPTYSCDRKGFIARVRKLPPQTSAMLDEFIAQCTKRENLIFYARLTKFVPWRLRDIAKIHNVTAESIRRSETRLIRKINKLLDEKDTKK